MMTSQARAAIAAAALPRPVAAGAPRSRAPRVSRTTLRRPANQAPKERRRTHDEEAPSHEEAASAEPAFAEAASEDERSSAQAPSEEGSEGGSAHDDAAPDDETPLASEAAHAEDAPSNAAAGEEAFQGDAAPRSSEDENLPAPVAGVIAEIAPDHGAAETGEPVIEQLGAGDGLEEVPERRRPPRRNYKIQEVIKRRQILLVQVVKEERGNKGAALTTYLSLAGRYSVLMPNTARGGGISRKITNAPDRKRLKSVAGELDVPDGMGVIVRTAGAARTKAEIKRDFEYLLRLWENVRELTLKSSAPALVHEEGSLIKRAIRDLYNKDIDEVLVAGDEGYKEAKDFMRMLAPSHAKVVKLDKETEPLYARFGVERQLDAMFSNVVTLRSGGYIVINQTEALVAIDVNSGRATREHNIEDTALKTNLEAAEEASRQLRLRDLAGLIVIDFIDMDEKRNNRSVEKRLKDCLKNDRARIQIGNISPFGLLEMSRQRIRSGVVEGSSTPCPHCGGAGRVRSTPSVALHVLRHVEDALVKNASRNLIVNTRTDIALYILNQKRRHLRQIEDRFGVSVNFVADEKHNGVELFAIELGEPVVRQGDAAPPETEAPQRAREVERRHRGRGAGREPRSRPIARNAKAKVARRATARKSGAGGAGAVVAAAKAKRASSKALPSMRKRAKAARTIARAIATTSSPSRKATQRMPTRPPRQAAKPGRVRSNPAGAAAAAAAAEERNGKTAKRSRLRSPGDPIGDAPYPAADAEDGGRDRRYGRRDRAPSMTSMMRRPQPPSRCMSRLPSGPPSPCPPRRRSPPARPSSRR